MYNFPPRGIGMECELIKVSNGRLFNSAAVFFVVSLLSACSSLPMTQSQNHVSSVMPAASSVLPAQVSDLLTENEQNVSVAILSGAYQDKTLIAGSAYFAASGRLCRKVLISDQMTKEKHVACKSDASSWTLVRSVM